LATETEIKVIIGDPGDFCRQLAVLNPTIHADRHFEDNYLLDFPDQQLRSRQCLLRIRSAGGRQFLTYKGPPRSEGIFKVREELETVFDDAAILLQTLERIGLRVCFQYQKYRREFAVGELRVAVDETPVGNYVEFEGPEDGIREAAARIGIDESRFLRSSYYTLYLDYCRDRGETPGFMVF